MGYDKDGNILKFDEDGDLVAGGNKIKDAIFISFSRLLAKDEIKKGSFELELGTDGDYDTPFSERIKIQDTNAANSYRVNPPAGEYGILYAGESAGTSVLTTDAQPGDLDDPVGLIYYQAGVVVLTASVFLDAADGGPLIHPTPDMSGVNGFHIDAMITGSTITSISDAIRHRIYNIH